MAGAALLLPWRRAYAAFATSPTLTKFTHSLRRFGPDIPVAGIDPLSPYTGVDSYKIAMGQFTDELHPDLPPTTLWGYGQGPESGFKHLGGAIVATENRAVRVAWENRLPNLHLLPVDPSVLHPEAAGFVNHAAPHLHGGLVPWPSDGGPFHWFTPEGVTGSSVVPWLPDNLGNLTNDYWYPNIQTPRMMWYHDHAVGTTRLNAYSGLATGYLLTSQAEAELVFRMGVQPGNQIPLVIQDKVFNTDGSLWYPNFYDTQFFGLVPGQPLPVPSLVPEFWGDTVLVNGTAYPTLKVYPRKYRFRVLNACNTRFINLQLFAAAGARFPGSSEPDYAKPGPVMTQIGNECGFLDGAVNPKGVPIATMAGMQGILLGPAERADIIIDFSKMKPGRYLILHNDAPVPFPGGTPLADFFPGNKKNPVAVQPGMSPNTRTLLQFVVGDPVADGVPADPTVDPTWALPAQVQPQPTVPNPRDLALYETIDPYGRLAQNLGTLAGPLNYFEDTPTENVQAGTVEIWRLFNVSADTHPIHFHYFNCRILSRQPFNAITFALSGQAIPPDPNEQGWKETVRANPGECVTLLVEHPTTAGLAPAPIPESPRLAAMGINNAHEYVWHCHILEHEEHDMMRPLIVNP
jgi:spore coat protein A